MLSALATLIDTVGDGFGNVIRPKGGDSLSQTDLPHDPSACTLFKAIYVSQKYHDTDHQSRLVDNVVWHVLNFCGGNKENMLVWFVHTTPKINCLETLFKLSQIELIII